MSFQKFKSDSYCVGGRHCSASTKFCDITSKDSKVIIGYCSVYNRKKSITVSDTTIQAESLGDFFKNLGKKGPKLSQKMTKNVIKKPGRALEFGANVGTAFTSRSPKTDSSSLLEVINFYHTGEGLYLGKFV